jgi:carbon-monoxide dehydrogenase medium subunit
VYLPDIAIHQAVTLEEASAALGRFAPDARLLAGGTDLLVDLKTGRARFGHLVSISRIAALRGVSPAGEGLRIGALTTITQLDRSPFLREPFTPIRDATSRMAAPQVRNLATVGGNVASAVPCADLPPILTAMNASVTLWSAKGQREVPLEEVIIGARRTILRDGEVLTAVVVPRPPSGFGAAYARFALRDGNAIAVAAVAASLTLHKGKTIQQARIVLGAVSPVPKPVQSAAARLIGQSPDDDAFRAAADAAMHEAEPISDVRGSADFRRQIVGIMARRALAIAYHRAKETL